MTVNIGNQEFRSYTEAKRHAKNILNQHSIGRDVEPEEMCFLVDALRLRGKRGLEKIGCGVSRIYINHNQYGHRGFLLSVLMVPTPILAISNVLRDTPNAVR
jgi:Protein of unknown function (DUF3223).